MATYDFTVSDVIPASAQDIFDAWLSTEGHTAMTGGEAHATAEVGGAFDAWGGYIAGVNLALEPGKRILQSWRTTNFEDGQEDSEIEVLLEPADGGTRVTLHHRNVPTDHTGYENGGWQSNYFDPMKEYFRE